MGERGGLGVLQVGEPRHHALPVLCGKGEEHLPELQEGCHLLEQFLPEPDPDTGRNFVVPRPADMEPPADLGARGFDEDRLDPRMDVLETVIEGLLGDSLVMHFQQGGEELFCHPAVNDLLLVQHQHVRNIHQDIRIGNMAVGMHRREELHHLARPFSGEPPQPYNIGSHGSPFFVTVVLVMLGLKPRLARCKLDRPLDRFAGDDGCDRDADELLDDARYNGSTDNGDRTFPLCPDCCNDGILPWCGPGIPGPSPAVHPPRPSAPR